MLRLLEPRPWCALVPDAKHELVTAGYGAGTGQADFVTAAMADDRRLGWRTCPRRRGSPWGWRHRGGADCQLVDPTSGRSIAAEGSPFANRGSRDFYSAAKNWAGDGDHVLVLEVAG